MAVWEVHHSPCSPLIPRLGGGIPPRLGTLLTQEQADRYHVLALCLEYNNVVVPEFSFNLNGNLRNDAHRKLGAGARLWGRLVLGCMNLQTIL